MTLEEYVDLICTRKGITRQQFKAYMGKIDMRIGVCNCEDYTPCKGWRLYHEGEFNSREEYINATYEIPT